MIARWFLAFFFIAAGTNHFLHTEIYLELMPPYLPWHIALVYVSGIAEILLGACVLPSITRRMAGWGLIALLIAVFPANIQAALHGFRSVSSAILWARLPLQLVLIWWVYWCCLSTVRSDRDRPEA
jgi:uncharacterized membrane protein